MKIPTLLLLSFAALLAPSGHAETVDGDGDDGTWSTQVDAATAFTFSGKIAFHLGDVSYDLTVDKGQVSGWQRWSGQDRPVGQITGGWFDDGRGRLSVYIQGADHVEARWRSQLKQFHLDVPAREVILDHELYGYGKTVEAPLVGKAHILDTLDRVEHLIAPRESTAPAREMTSP